MKWSLSLGSFAGIRVYLHWTFVLLLGWILFSHLGQGHDWAEAWLGVGFIIALFGCVLLHEFRACPDRETLRHLHARHHVFENILCIAVSISVCVSGITASRREIATRAFI